MPMEPGMILRLGQMEGKIDTLLVRIDDIKTEAKEHREVLQSQFEQRTKEHMDNFAKVDRQVRHLQKFQYMLMGGGAVVGACLGYVFHIVGVLP
jgi:uncharacterized protein YjcR